MTSHFMDSDITAAIIPFVTSYPESMPITPQGSRGIYEKYVGYFTPQDHFEPDAFDYLRLQPENIGRLAVKKYVSPDSLTTDVIEIALLNESAARMPLQPIDPTLPESELVRITGEIDIQSLTYTNDDCRRFVDNPLNQPYSVLSIRTSILEDGRGLLEGFYATHSCQNPECNAPFRNSRQARIIGQLGLQRVFTTNRKKTSYTLSTTSEKRTLTPEQTLGYANYIHEFFSDGTQSLAAS